MGYTHYWHRPKELDKDKFTQVIEDCKTICSVLPVPLGDGLGEGHPLFSHDIVCFNGHVKSNCLMGAATVSIPWPADNAVGIATGADKPKEGKWFAGDLLNSRCVDENGDGSYETFEIVRSFKPEGWQSDDEGTGKKNRWFAFCKTAFRPYDLNVQCCLIVFNQYFGDVFEVSSDGTSEQWNEARSICQHILGYGLLFELKED